MTTQQDSAPPTGGRWPQPRVLELQVAEIYRHAPTATAFSYFGALLVLGVMIQTGDTGRGSAWFLWATIVAAIATPTLTVRPIMNASAYLGASAPDPLLAHSHDSSAAWPTDKSRFSREAHSLTHSFARSGRFFRGALAPRTREPEDLRRV